MEVIKAIQHTPLIVLWANDKFIALVSGPIGTPQIIEVAEEFNSLRQQIAGNRPALSQAVDAIGNKVENANGFEAAVRHLEGFF